MSNYFWTKYTFDTYPLNGFQDATECGLMCELSVDHCDFFTTDMGKCHLGRYNHSYLGEVVGSNVAMTYHNQGNKKLGINSKIFQISMLIHYIPR